MGDDKRQQLEERIRELEDYLEGLAKGGAGGYARPTERSTDQLDREITQTRRDIEDLKRQLASAK